MYRMRASRCEGRLKGHGEPSIDSGTSAYHILYILPVP